MKQRKQIFRFTLFTFFLGFALIVQAQNQRLNNEERQAQMMEKLIEHLELTDDEEKQFRPVYEAFLGDRKELQDNEIRDIIDGKKMSELSDREIEEVLQASFEKKQAMLNLQREYHEKFKQIIPINKVAKLYLLQKRIPQNFQNRTIKGKKRLKER